MPFKCKHTGCRRFARPDGQGFCRAHQGPASRTRHIRLPRRNTLPEAPRGFYHQFRTKDTCTLAAKLMRLYEARYRIPTNACRRVERNVTAQEQALLRDIMLVAIQHLPVANATDYIMAFPQRVVAPPVEYGRSAVTHPNGVLHRDLWETWSPQRRPAYTALVCATAMTRQNGAVELYPCTLAKPIDLKYRARAVQGEESVILTGEQGRCVYPLTI